MEPTPTTNGKACSTCGPWWRLPVLLAIVLGVILATRNRGVREDAREIASESPTNVSDDYGVVILAIDFGNGQEQRTIEVAWKEGMTVGDLMTGASQSPNGIVFEKQGTGEMTLLTRIDGLSNEGAGGRNWIYSVNTERADRSYFIYPLQAGDRVLWEFTGQQ